MNKQILEAPNYQIDEKGVVTNIAKGNVVLPSKDGKVGLYTTKHGVFGGRPIQEKVRIFLNIADLLKQYHEVKDGNLKEEKVESYSDFKKSKKSVKKDVKKEGKSGADLIREAYDKNPESFDMKKFAEESGISYNRVWGCIKKYKAKLSSK